MSKIEEMEKRYPGPLPTRFIAMSDIKWLIARVKSLEEAIKDLECENQGDCHGPYYTEEDPFWCNSCIAKEVLEDE